MKTKLSRRNFLAGISASVAAVVFRPVAALSQKALPAPSPLPPAKGRTIKFRRYGRLPPVTTPLAEGVVHKSTAIGFTEIVHGDLSPKFAARAAAEMLRRCEGNLLLSNGGS